MKIKNLLRVLAMSIALFAFGDTETVTNVRGVQRENSKLVDIYYDLNATDYGTYTVGVEIEGRTVTVTATTFTGDVGEGVMPGSNRHIVWNAGTDWPNKKGDVRAIVTATKEDPTVSHGKGQLWEGGPYWADRNIGAFAPEDSGLYFWWGDTTGDSPSSDGEFLRIFSPDNSDIYTYGKGVSELQSAGWVTSDGVLAPAHDAAHVKWGGSWRMPTRQEFEDLVNKCDWTWKRKNGVYGYVVRGRDACASNSIFLPSCGYWSSKPDTVGLGYLNLAWYLYTSDHPHTRYNCYRYNGLAVRPVQGFSN